MKYFLTVTVGAESRYLIDSATVKLIMNSLSSDGCQVEFCQ